MLLATPGSTHAEQVNACLDAGKPVLCEKPLTTDVASSYAIVQKEASLGAPLIQVGFMRRFDPEYVALKELITSGGLGNPLMVHCTHRNPAVPDHFNSEFMIRDSVVHEVDVARFLLGEEITVGPGGQGCCRPPAAPEGTNDPMLVIFEMASGRIVTDEIYVRSAVAYEVRTEVVGESGSALIGLDQNLQVKSTDGRWGGQITPGFVERFGQAYAVELQRWVDAAKLRHDRRARRLGRLRRRRGVRSGRAGREHRRRRCRWSWAPDLRRPAGSPPPTWKEPGREAGSRPADVLLDQHGSRAARSRGPAGLRVDGAVAEGGLRAVLQVPADRRRRGPEAEEGRRPTPGWGSLRCCRCCAGPGRTRTSGRLRFGPGSGRSRSRSTSGSR